MTKEVTKSGDSIEYQYDSCGNLLKITHNNTTKEFDNTEDRCNSIKINGYTKNIEYDENGNIIKYGDFEYIYNNLNQLTKCIHIKDNVKMIYKYYYDFVGRRYRKLISTEKNNNIIKLFDYYYYYNGNQLMSISCHNYEENNTRYIHYFYDEIGLCGLEYDGNYYGIICDTLGNVSKITDNDRVIIEYTYDAFGNTSCKLVSGEDFYFDYFFNKIIELNALTYRGYHYDVETNIALVSSRYYSPELGRFIQPADVSSLNPQSINGLNQYTYALNNPIIIKYDNFNGRIVSVLNSNIGTQIGPSQGNTSISGSSFLPGLYGGINSMFNIADALMSYAGGVWDGLLSLLGSPRFDNFQTKLSTVSKWMAGIGVGLDIISSAINNYNDDNLTTGQKWASFGADAGYYVVKGALSYAAGSLLTSGAVALGTAAGCAAITYLGAGFLGASLIAGGIVAVAIVGGPILIAVLSDALDNWWEKKKEEWFN